MSASTTNTIFGTFVADIGTVLSTSLPVVLGVAAALIGLGIVIRYVKRWVGRK
jgi:phage-related minor tail protein